MDGDFSVRNEVDSLNPPQGGGNNFEYAHEPSAYDDIVEGIKNAPPFPSIPIDHPDPWVYHQHQLYNSVLSQQLALIRQQQLANDRLMKLLEKKDSINWKYITFALAVFGLILIIRPRVVPRRNPQREKLLNYLDELSDY